MKKNHTLVCLSVLFLTIPFARAASEEIFVRSPNGEHLALEIDPTEPFGDVIKKIAHQLAGEDNDEFYLDYAPVDIKLFKAFKGTRDYNAEASKKEKDLITYILTTMANKNPIQLWKEEKSLRKAGDKIIHLHPYRFLMCIFKDETLKAAIASVKERILLWSKFKEGLFDSLTEEAQKNNLVPYVDDFAANLEISSNLILPAIHEGNWEQLINLLIKNVPREGEPDRYNDM